MDKYFSHRKGRGSRFFGRGDVKFAFLDLLAKEPMHGYKIMKELEDQSGGMYSPSPGSTYPTLQMLEDRGFVTSKDEEDRKIYAITVKGTDFLEEWKKSRNGDDPLHIEPHNRRKRDEQEWYDMKSAGKDLLKYMYTVEHHPELNKKQMKSLETLYRKLHSEIVELKILNTSNGDNDDSGTAD